MNPLDRIVKILEYVFMGFIAYTGIFMIVRSSIPTSYMTIVTGKVVDKDIVRTSTSKGYSYGLTFKLQGRNERIAFEGSKSSMSKSMPLYFLVDTGKTYTFYLNPTAPEKDGIIRGIEKIDYRGNEIFRSNYLFGIILGISLFLGGIVGIIWVYKKGKKKQRKFGNA